jgi:hypothetical protein
LWHLFMAGTSSSGEGFSQERTAPVETESSEGLLDQLIDGLFGK